MQAPDLKQAWLLVVGGGVSKQCIKTYQVNLFTSLHYGQAGEESGELLEGEEIRVIGCELDQAPDG